MDPSSGPEQWTRAVDPSSGPEQWIRTHRARGDDGLPLSRPAARPSPGLGFGLGPGLGGGRGARTPPGLLQVRESLAAGRPGQEPVLLDTAAGLVAGMDECFGPQDQQAREGQGRGRPPGGTGQCPQRGCRQAAQGGGKTRNVHVCELLETVDERRWIARSPDGAGVRRIHQRSGGAWRLAVHVAFLMARMSTPGRAAGPGSRPQKVSAAGPADNVLGPPHPCSPGTSGGCERVNAHERLANEES